MANKGRSEPGLFGRVNHYDEHGKKVGYSEGCYVATCVYGSYDCPQVWTLRRFWDHTLGKRLWGRTFIRTYYAVSPTIVRWFGDTRWFKEMWRGVLDGMVRRLNEKGLEDTPYQVSNLLI